MGMLNVITITVSKVASTNVGLQMREESESGIRK